MITIYNFSASSNTGDRNCSPNLYFDEFKDCPVKQPWEWTPGKSIFGGGGMLHPGTDHWIARAVESKERTVVWGIGLNYHGVMAQLYPKFLDDCGMVGMRESGNPWDFVPCQSCMAKAFDSGLEIQPSHPLVIYEHGQNRFSQGLGQFPTKNNEDGGTLDDAVRFLASGEIVLTNTFHGAYWAGLIGRPAVVYRPFSNRFLALTSCIECDEKNWAEKVDLARKTRPLPPVNLEKARAINRSFAIRVREFLS